MNLSRLKYCLLIFCRQTVSVSCGNLPTTNTAYLVGFRGRRKFIGICGKFTVVSRRIWQTGPRNLEKFAAENCGP